MAIWYAHNVAPMNKDCPWLPVYMTYMYSVWFSEWFSLKSQWHFPNVLYGRMMFANCDVQRLDKTWLLVHYGNAIVCTTTRDIISRASFNNLHFFYTFGAFQFCIPFWGYDKGIWTIKVTGKWSRKMEQYLACNRQWYTY